jgi:hypothetical protein
MIASIWPRAFFKRFINIFFCSGFSIGNQLSIYSLL